MISSSMINDDFENVAEKLPKADLILTDPPYNRREATHCFELLAKYAPIVLKDGGSLIAITPHYLMERVMEIMSGSLKYRWVYSMDQIDGPHPRMAMGIEVMWKPNLHYVKRAYPHGRGFIKDKLVIPRPEKDLHEWQQSEEWARFFISKLTNPGDMVIDPFCGPGTVPAVCKSLERNCIGIEINERTYRDALERISNYPSR